MTLAGFPRNANNKKVYPIFISKPTKECVSYGRVEVSEEESNFNNTVYTVVSAGMREDGGAFEYDRHVVCLCYLCYLDVGSTTCQSCESQPETANYRNIGTRKTLKFDVVGLIPSQKVLSA